MLLIWPIIYELFMIAGYFIAKVIERLSVGGMTW